MRTDFYIIRLRGQLDTQWSQWFDGLEITDGYEEGADITTLRGPVRDQSALRGILNKIWDLNLELLSVNQIEYHPERALATRIFEDEDHE